MGYLRWVTVLALLSVVTACAGTKNLGLQPTGSDPDGRTFVVTGVTQAGKARPLVTGSQIRLRFDGDRLVVTAGCNTMSGTFRLEGSRLVTDPLASTEMGCDPALMDQDTWVAGLFTRPGQLTTENDAAYISGDVVLALADRETVSPDVPLERTRWRLTGINDDETASSVQSLLMLSFSRDGRTARMALRCGRLTSPVTVDGDQVAWGALAEASHSCPYSDRRDEERRVDQAVRDVLKGPTTAKVTERTLTITRGSDGLVFTAVPA